VLPGCTHEVLAQEAVRGVVGGVELRRGGHEVARVEELALGEEGAGVSGAGGGRT
jgi:hypothetical protein